MLTPTELHPAVDDPWQHVAAEVFDEAVAFAAGGGDATMAWVANRVREQHPLLSPANIGHLSERVMADLHGFGRLDLLLNDPDVSEVMVNGPGPVWVERDGTIQVTDLVMSAREIGRISERIVTPLGLRVDRTSPMVDARLPDGSRVNIVVPPLAVDGPYITIRRFAARPLPVTDFTDAATAHYLKDAVRNRANIVVSGGTGAGKTTLLNALAGYVDHHERIVTIEDAAELQLPNRHVVRLESRPPTADGIGQVSIRDLVRNALRMRPDRIVVGEVRGAEALDMIQAMNTGHAGSLCSCHANSPADALRRLETMVLMAGMALPLATVTDHLRSAIDLVVQVSRTGSGRREIVGIAGVDSGGLTEFELPLDWGPQHDGQRHDGQRNGVVGS